MKKIFSVALLACSLFFMVGCGTGSSSSYNQGDPAPKIDSEKGTVNGRSYDTKTERCWKVTVDYTVYEIPGVGTKEYKETSYVWATQFDLVQSQETAMWTAAQLGKYAKGSYNYVVTTDKDYDSCVNHNTSK